MASYLGAKCPVCAKKFAQEDDIVVCPVCGAPHHRECYAEKKECAFVSEHINGKVWQAPVEAQSEADTNSAFKTCTKCKMQIPKDALFCHICGQNVNSSDKDGADSFDKDRRKQEYSFDAMDFKENPLYNMNVMEINMDGDIDGESANDIAAYVGPSSVYYIPRFKIMSENPKVFSPNFAALFFGFFFCFYRKMYVPGIVLLAIFIVGFIPGCMYSVEMLPAALEQMDGMGFSVMVIEQARAMVPPIESVDYAQAEYYLGLKNIFRFVSFAIRVIFSFCANKFYYEKCINAVKKIRTGGEGEDTIRENYRGLLLRAGGVSKISVPVACVFIAVAYFVVNTFVVYLTLY